LSNIIITKRKIERILRDIQYDDECSIMDKNRNSLKEINLFDLFQESGRIADKKFPDSPEQDYDYKKYRLQHFRETLKEKRLVIGL